MRNPKSKIIEKLKAYSNYVLLFVFLLIFISLTRNILRVRETKKKVEKSQEHIKGMKEENKKLEDRLEKAKSEEFIEQQLRDKLDLAKEGETVMILPDEETLRKFATSMEEEEETLPSPNWEKWLKLFY